MNVTPDATTSANQRRPIPIPKGGFRSNQDDARWLEQTLIMRMNETLQDAGINAKWHPLGLYDLLLLSLNAASRRSETALWCIRLVGPDDLQAASSQAAARAMADKHNSAIRKMIEQRPEIIDDGITAASMLAVVEQWPWSAEAHARDLLDV